MINDSKSIDCRQLDKATLEFAIKIAWQFEFNCRPTKEGRARAHAYRTVQSTLQGYLDRLDEDSEHKSSVK